MRETSMTLSVFKKLPLGGVDRRDMAHRLAADGAAAAGALAEAQKRDIRPQGAALGKDTCVLILGGSNGITRAIAMQLLFGERANVWAVHFDSEKLQIGPHHIAAMAALAKSDGLNFRSWNADATKPETIAEVVLALKEHGFRAVHLVNGIAAGATKRYPEHGTTEVMDLDVAFDPVLQVPDFSSAAPLRGLGLVHVETCTDVDIERTNRFMGTSTTLWIEPLAEAGLVVRGESIVAFCDYEYEPDDPVYALGPLAGAKVLQRKSLEDIAQRFGARTSRICYPAVCTTALGAIPGGTFMYAMTAQILKEQDKYTGLLGLGAGTMGAFQPSHQGDLRLDLPFQAALPEFHRRKAALQKMPEGLHSALSRVIGKALVD